MTLQMALGDGSLRSEELVGDGSMSGNQDYTAQNCARIRGCRGGDGGSSAGAESEGYCAQRGFHTPRKPGEAFRPLETAKMETLENKSNIAAMK